MPWDKHLSCCWAPQGSKQHTCWLLAPWPAERSHLLIRCADVKGQGTKGKSDQITCRERFGGRQNIFHYTRYGRRRHAWSTQVLLDTQSNRLKALTCGSCNSITAASEWLPSTRETMEGEISGSSSHPCGRRAGGVGKHSRTENCCGCWALLSSTRLSS